MPARIWRQAGTWAEQLPAVISGSLCNVRRRWNLSLSGGCAVARPHLALSIDQEHGAASPGEL